MKECLTVFGAVLFVAASASASAIYDFSVNATSQSTLTTFSITCTGMPSSCSGMQLSQITVSSGPGSGAFISSLSVGSTQDVAVFANAFGDSWTFNLDTSKVTGEGTFGFTGSSAVSHGSSGWVGVSGALVLSKATTMPETMTFWSLLLVLIPVFFVCWRQGLVPSPDSPAL